MIGFTECNSHTFDASGICSNCGMLEDPRTIIKHNMNLLPQTFDGSRDQKVFKFRQLRREGQIVLLEKSFKDGSSDSRWYEVALLRNVPFRTFPNGLTTPAHEAMPKPEDWGMYAWSYSDLESAKVRFNREVDALKSKPLEYQ